jgi:hypothetical protein
MEMKSSAGIGQRIQMERQIRGQANNLFVGNFIWKGRSRQRIFHFDALCTEMRCGFVTGAVMVCCQIYVPITSEHEEI